MIPVVAEDSAGVAQDLRGKQGRLAAGARAESLEHEELGTGLAAPPLPRRAPHRQLREGRRSRDQPRQGFYLI